MKNYNVKGLVGRVSIDTDCFIKALNDKKDIILFVSGNNCPRCTLLENEIKEHPGVLIFEIKYEDYNKASNLFNDLPFVYSFPTGLLIENGKVILSEPMSSKPVDEFYELLVSRLDTNTIDIQNPFDPVFAKDGSLRRYKTSITSIDKF